MPDPIPTPTLAQRLALKCLARATTLGLRGKKRDEMALEYFQGALALGSIEGCETDSTIEMATYFISIRGFSWVQELATKCAEAQAPVKEPIEEEP